MQEIDILNRFNTPCRIAMTKNAKNRLIERNIVVNDILNCIDKGEVIKQYEEDKPLPSCLILEKSLDQKPFHVVVSSDNDYIYLTTAYYPDPQTWDAEFRVRKRC